MVKVRKPLFEAKMLQNDDFEDDFRFPGRKRFTSFKNTYFSGSLKILLAKSDCCKTFPNKCWKYNLKILINGIYDN